MAYTQRRGEEKKPYVTSVPTVVTPGLYSAPYVVTRKPDVAPKPKPEPKPEEVLIPIYAWRGSPYGIQRRVIVGYKKPDEVTALELKQQEYKTFAREYVAPIVRTAVEAEREAELREFEKKLDPLEQQARREFEARLEVEREKALLYVPREQLEAARESPEVKAWEREQRAQLETTVTKWKEEQRQTFREQWKPRGLAERIMAFDPWKAGLFVAEALTGRKATETEKRVHREFGEYVSGEYLYEKYGIAPVPFMRPTETLAGVVAYPETLAYAGLTFVGAEPPTRPPPSPFKVAKEKPGYLFGYYMGLVGTSIIVGKVLAKTPVGRFEAKIWERTGAKLESYLRAKWQALRGTTETGFQRGAFGMKGYEITTIKGKPGTPQFPEYRGWFPEEGWEEFITQTARATQRPVPIHVEKGKPWLAIIKHPPTEVGGGLTETLTRTEIVDLPKLALRGISRKTLLAPYLMIPPKVAYPAVTPLFITLGIEAVPKPLVAPSPVIAAPLIEVMTAPKLKPIEVLKPKEIVFPGIRQVPLIFQIPTAIAKEKEMPIQVSVPTQKQLLKQIETTVQTTIQIQPSPSPLLTPQVPSWLRLPTYERRRRRRRKKGEDFLDLFGRYKRFYPVMPPKKALKKLLGK